MKYDDIVWCIKDFYRPFDHPDPLLNYPKHAFYKGLGYKIFAINQERSNHYLKKHFKKIEIDKMVESEIELLKIGLSKLEEKYIKEVRKEKLDKIKKC